MADIFTLVSDPTRRAILELLLQGPLTAGDIAERFPIAREGISKHLRLLRDSGAVRVEAEGRRRTYFLEPEALRELDEWLNPYRAFWGQRLEALGTEIARGKRRAQASGRATSTRKRA